MFYPHPAFRYFEKRLHATEESHKEEIALLQLKLVEGALEDSLLKMTDDGYFTLSGYKNKIHALQFCTNVFVNIQVFGLCFSALSQSQAQADKDVLSYTVQLEKQRVRDADV